MERDKSPMVKSLNELGDRMRAVGLEKREALQTTQPKVEKKTSPWATKSTAAPLAMTAPPSPTRTTPTWAGAPAASSALNKSTLSLTASPVATSSALPRVPAARALSSTSFSSTASRTTAAPTAAAAPSANDDDNCAVCHLALVYGELIQLPKTKELMHRACFVCAGCREMLSSGTHVSAEGSIWHHACAPAPKRYRSIVTSIKEDVVDDVPGGNLFEEDGETACAGCTRLIGPAPAVTIPTSGKTFHQDCFICAGCRAPFAAPGGQRSFVEVRGQAYHSTCAPATTLPAASAEVNPLKASTSRTVVPPTLPASASIPKLYHTPTSPTSVRGANPSSPSALFATRARPTPKFGGLIVCAGCSVRATEKETVTGPMGRRWHAKCLKCFDCARGLDSEARVGEDDHVRCESCRRGFARRSAAVGAGGRAGRVGVTA